MISHSKPRAWAGNCFAAGCVACKLMQGRRNCAKQYCRRQCGAEQELKSVNPCLKLGSSGCKKKSLVLWTFISNHGLVAAISASQQWEDVLTTTHSYQTLNLVGFDTIKCKWAYNSPSKISGKPLYKHLRAHFLLSFQNQWEDSKQQIATETKSKGENNT